MNKRKRTFLIFLLIALILVIVGACVFLVVKTIVEQNTEDDYNSLAESYASTEDELITAPSVDTEAVENPIDFDSLADINSEIYSWIYVPDTNINYPVCQSTVDDNYYLDHDVYKSYSYSGAIYSQVCNSLDYSDRVTVLYGHNMASGAMFANLHKFADADFFDSHKYFYVYTPDRKLTYEVVSAFTYDNRHIMNSFDFSDDEVFEDYLDMILNPRSVSKNVREDVELSTDDNILTLSTCTSSGDGRYLLQGVLVKDEYAE
ncbi:MAG: class B sortase [Clostridiales bacterium]|nr:class B sortase [Clostridiales bacterium]